MKRLNLHRIWFVLAGSIAAIVMGGIKPANAATIEVGVGEGHDFATIQAGIDTASDGDTILVAPGEYVVTEPITFRGKAIIVKSEAGPDVTIIWMGTPADTNRGSVVVFENNETVESVLDGFTITGGRGSWWPSADKWGGGGIVFDASSGTVRNCAVVENTAKNGGGVLVFSGASPTLTDCTIRGNSAIGVTYGVDGYGGGLHCGISSSMTLTNCTITGNSAGRAGGGGHCWLNISLIMTDCAIMNNTAELAGAGIVCDSGSAILTNCIIARNTGVTWGGGLCSLFVDSSMTISNCTIWGNSATEAGGIGCYQGGLATVTNSIFWGNTATKGNEIYLEQYPTVFSITYSNIAGGQAGVRLDGGSKLDWGEGNIDADPLFADPNNDDFHLKSEASRWDPTSHVWALDDVNSPCIDVGDPNSSIAFELNPNGGIINMGAYGGTAEASKSPSGLHAKYGGGTGEPNDPYLIYTVEHLNTLGAEPNDYDKHFKLMADINLSGYVYNRAVIAPDINDANRDFDGMPFTGVFEGNNHIISSLTIVGESYLGLFGRLESRATVSNLGLEAVDVSGMDDHVGGLVGLNHEDTNITSSYSTGKVTGREYVGGLVGSSIRGGSITASYSTSAVTGDKYVGGLVGCNDSFLLFAETPETPPSRITDCFSNSTVNGTGWYVGGLVGVNYAQGSITASYSTGAVTGDKYVGGLVGWHGSWGISGWGEFPRSTVADCFSNSTVTGGGYVGGLVGMNYDEGSITNSYSTGAVTGDKNVGGLVGCNSRSHSITSSFWDIHTSGLTYSYGGTGLTAAELQTATTYLEGGWDFIGETDNGTEDIWWIDEGQDYPRLWWELITEN